MNGIIINTKFIGRPYGQEVHPYWAPHHPISRLSLESCQDLQSGKETTASHPQIRQAKLIKKGKFGDHPRWILFTGRVEDADVTTMQHKFMIFYTLSVLTFLFIISLEVEPAAPCLQNTMETSYKHNSSHPSRKIMTGSRMDCFWSIFSKHMMDRVQSFI